MDTVETLREARKLVERGWTQYTMARAEDGVPTSEYSELACSWCAMGAVYRVPSSDPEVALDVLSEAIGRHDVVDWNDYEGRTVNEVLAAFDRAIVLAESRQ